MSSCRDCIYYDICEMYDGAYINTHLNEHLCNNFKDKSLNIELPYELIGTTFYAIYNDEIHEHKCFWLIVYGRNDFALVTDYGFEFVLGDRAFLTKEEAEKALKERENE